MLLFLSISVKSRFISISHHLLKMNRSASTFSLQDYDCIGFDLDHTLCSYRLGPLHQLIYSTLATFLVEEKGYPRALLQQPTDPFFSQKGLVLDKQRGNILKLDSGHRIDRASHGTRPMDRTEVNTVYGPGRIWQDNLVPRLVKGVVSEMQFYIFKDAFVTPAALLCGKIVDLLDAESDRGPHAYEFFGDYLEGLHRMYDRENFGRGGFFPAMRSDPGRYLEPCSDRLLKWLEGLKEKKATFLVTSANQDAADLVASHCLGRDWRRLFDSVVTYARKPGFFFKRNPFLDEFGVRVSEPSKGAAFSEGNFQGLREALAKDSRQALDVGDSPAKSSQRILYVGDSLVEDVYSGNVGGECDTVAIVDEMKGEEKGQWGSFFAVEDKGPSLWADLISRHSRLAVPDMETLAKLRVEDRVAAFEEGSPVAGYYPHAPEGLKA